MNIILSISYEYSENIKDSDRIKLEEKIENLKPITFIHHEKKTFENISEKEIESNIKDALNSLKEYAKIQGVLSLCVFMPFDKTMNKLLGDEWLFRKEQIAHYRAEKAIQKIKGSYDKQIDVQFQHHH